MMVPLVVFLLGLVVLYFGAEVTLNGAVGIATRLGISPLVIGLTLVAYGTSCPELALDISAALKGTTDLAFGDLVGSNIANVGLILGVAAMFRPLNVHMRLLRAELPIAIACSIAVLGLAADGLISRQDGLFLLAGFVLFTGYTIRAARKESRAVQREIAATAAAPPPAGRSLGMMVLGLVALVVGAQLMVWAAILLARRMQVSELVIGITIVALGTSLPELATSIVAARRNESDIVVGNVIGSNIFNLLLVLALVAVICPVPVASRSLTVDLPVMIAFVAVLVPIMLKGRVVSQREGLLLVVGMIGFLLWQVISAVTG